MVTQSADRTPDRDRFLFICPFCEAFTSHEWADLVYLDDDDYQQNTVSMLEVRPAGDSPWDEVDPHHPYDSWKSKGVWARSRCIGCQELTIWREQRIIHPTSVAGAPPAHEDMPPGARKLYDEARLVVAVSRRAGAAMARATLELLLKEVDADAPVGLNLDGRIQRAVDRVSDSLGALLDVIRHIGNKALHVDAEPDSAVVLVLDEENEEIVEVLFSAINDLVDELVTKPARALDLSSQLPQGVQDGIRRRAELASKRNGRTA